MVALIRTQEAMRMNEAWEGQDLGDVQWILGTGIGEVVWHPGGQGGELTSL